MGNGSYLGLALSGETKADHSGEQNLIDAEKGAAQQRLADQAKKDKARKDLLKEVHKNTVWSQNMLLSRNQARAEEIVGESMLDIVNGINDGSMAMGEVYESMRGVESKMNALSRADKQNFDAFQKYAENPSIYGGVKTINVKGKDYKTPIELYNDRSLTTQEIAEAMRTTEFASMPNEVLGEDVMNIDFRERMTAENAADVALKEKAEWFNVYNEGKKITNPSGKQTYVPTFHTLSDEGKAATMQAVKKSTMVMDHYTDQILDEPSNVLKVGSDEMFDEVQKRIDTDLTTYLDNAKKTGRVLDFSHDKAKATGVDVLFNVSKEPQVTRGHRGTPSGATSYEYIPTKAKMKITPLPVGTVSVNSEGYFTEGGPDDELFDAKGASKKVAQAKAMPWRLSFSDKDIWFDYAGDEEEYHAVPLSASSYRDWVNRTEETPEEVMRKIKKLTKNDASIMKQTRGFYKELWGDDEGSKNPTEAEFNAAWAKLKSGESTIGPDGKTYTKK